MDAEVIIVVVDVVGNSHRRFTTSYRKYNERSVLASSSNTCNNNQHDDNNEDTDHTCDEILSDIIDNDDNFKPLLWDKSKYSVDSSRDGIRLSKFVNGCHLPTMTKVL